MSQDFMEFEDDEIGEDVAVAVAPGAWKRGEQADSAGLPAIGVGGDGEQFRRGHGAISLARVAPAGKGCERAVSAEGVDARVVTVVREGVNES